MTSAKKRLFVEAAVIISFFVYVVTSISVRRIFSSVILSSTAAFVLSLLSLNLIMSRFPEETREEIASDDGEAPIHVTSKWKLIAWFIITTVLMLAMNFGVSLLSGDTSVPDKDGLLLRAVFGILLYPFMEEYLFRRGYITAFLKGNVPVYVCIIYQATLFATLHDGYGTTVAFICGIILGVTYVKAPSKAAFPMVYASHAIYNGVLYLILALT